MITLDTPGANYRAVWAMNKNFPNAKIYVRAHDIEHGLNLEKAGATAGALPCFSPVYPPPRVLLECMSPCDACVCARTPLRIVEACTSHLQGGLHCNTCRSSLRMSAVAILSPCFWAMVTASC